MQARVARSVWAFVAGGADSEYTYSRNLQAFEWVGVRPGIPIEPSTVDCRTAIFGRELGYPILVGPSSGQGDIHHGGEAVTYAGATAARTTTVVSHYGPPIDRVAAAAQGELWRQLYFLSAEAARKRVAEAEQAGCRAIVLTADSPYASHRERLLRLRRHPDPEEDGGSAMRAYGLHPKTPRMTWASVDPLRSFTRLPLLLKGVLTAEDARLAVEHGFDGVVVSNHGGRVLDHNPSTLEVLPEVVAAVKGRIPVLIDSGFRHGDDVLKALALGAHAVLLGRPILWALGAFGAPGVQRALEILQGQFRRAMAQAGCRSIAAIGPHTVTTSFP